MVFSSHLFIFYFLPLALGLYYLMPRAAQHLVLTLLSYLFYGWANPLFMVLMLTSTAIDYLAGLVQAYDGFRWRRPIPGPLPPASGRRSGRSRIQKIALALSIVSNLSLLACFKYFNFATENYNAALDWMGLGHLALDNVMRITLPLGISFYTFQSMSYSIDIYRGHAAAMRNPVDFACYVSMFPQLVAGPIIRFSEIDDQLRFRTHTLEKFSRGVSFVCLGLAKKVMLANPCGKVADMAFDASAVGFLDAWVGVTAYAFQIYFDFSAYSDLAIGLGLMLGFTFAKNFDSPYKSRSITEFWTRWHLSLSHWLRDYLYIPLGGNRLGHHRTYINLMTVMVLGGLWHGASWNFVIWGAIHGGMLAFERAQGKQSIYRNLPGPLKVAITFVIVCFAWVFFRAADLPAAMQYAGAMLGLGAADPAAALIAGVIYQPYYIGTILVAAAVAFFGVQTWDWTRRITWVRIAVITAALLLSLALLSAQAYNPFIYFIF